MMDQAVRVFGDGWRARVVDNAPGDSWAHVVMATLHGNGGRYLEILALWFGQFPLASKKQRGELKRRLESLTTSDHLGAVNELSWYQFMRRAGLQASPIPTANAPRPDFKVTAPAEFFVEVSTLNVSEAERESLLTTGGVDINHHATLKRILLKVTDEKDAQIAHAASEGRPCLLVLFDYAFWSGHPTNCFHFLARGLLGERLAFAQLPVTLSAIAYVKRQVQLDGHIEISQRRSAIYYNPAADYPLAVGSFDLLPQFWRDIGEIQPQPQEDWIRL
jgi:hypothetical protein